MKKSSQWVCGFFGGLLLAHAVCQAGEAKPIDSKVALATIASLGKKVETARWHVESKSGNFADVDQPASLDAARGELSCSVVSEPGPRRYRLEIEGTQAWVDGADPFVSRREICTFDGEIHRRWQLSRPGNAKLKQDDQTGTGRIEKELGASQGCLEALAGNCGLQLFPPMFPTLSSAAPVRLSDFLSMNEEAANRLVVTEDSSGNWTIETVDKEHDVRILFSPKKAMVLKAEWAGTDPARPGFHDEYRWLRVEVDPQPIGDFWAPRAATVCYTADKPPQGDHLIFSSVVINEPVSRDTYLIDFPLGTNLTDFIAEKAYVVSGDPVDDQAAVRAFMLSQGLSPNDGGGTRTHWPIATVGIVLLIVVAFAMLARRLVAGRRAASALLVISLASSAAGASETAQNVVPFKDAFDKTHCAIYGAQGLPLSSSHAMTDGGQLPANGDLASWFRMRERHV